MQIQCNVCPRQCNAIRTETENLGGFCKMPILPVAAKSGLHFWEEPCISGKKGSGTVFFSGCTLKCVFCQNNEISQNNFGKRITIQRLAEIIKELEKMGAHNINFVTPTHYIYAIEEALKIYTPSIPLVYNSSGYELKEVINKDLFDIYLLDFKYFSNEKAAKYSFAGDYPKFAMDAILTASNNTKTTFDKDGMMQSGVIIRHLLMPSNTNDAIKIIDWWNKNVPQAYFSLMAQYLPLGNAGRYPEINRKVTKREYEKVINYLMETNNERAFVQELSSSDAKYIPIFDLSGI